MIATKHQSPLQDDEIVTRVNGKATAGSRIATGPVAITKSLIDTKLNFKIVLMSPEFAQALLDKMGENRNPKPWKIAQFESDMRAGRWKLTHQGIALDESGVPLDGRNRLTAVIRSGVSVPMVIARQVPRSSVVAFDSGTPRNLPDAARFLGLKHVGFNEASTVNAMLNGFASKREPRSIQEQLALIQKYRAGLDFAFEVFHFNVKAITQAPVRAVVARASYHRSKPRLREFAKIMLDGIPGNLKTDTAAIHLRNWLLSTLTDGLRKQAVRPKPPFVYARSEYALLMFLEKKNIDELEEADIEQFPIPK